MRSCAQTASQESRSLKGTVTNRLTGVPVALADVLLVRQDTPTFSATAVADADGRFQFKDLSQGSYSLTAKRSEFLPSQSVAVSVGPEPTDSRLQLLPLGVIAGNVFAEDGDPLSGAVVAALRVITEEGKPALSQIAQTTTDDLGSYRLHGLPPGRYYIRVNLTDHSTHAADSLESEGHAVFYPLTTNQDQATALDIVAGSAIAGISLVLPKEHTSTVSDARSTSATESTTVQGQVLNSATGDPVSNAKVALWNGDNAQREALSTRSDASGHFTFGGVLPGAYRVTAAHTGFLIAGSLGSERNVTVTASQALDGVILHLMPQGVIAGRVLEDGTPVSNATVMATRLSFVADQRRLVVVRRTYSNDLGEYRLFDLPPGRYYVNITYHDGNAFSSSRSANTSTGESDSPQEDSVSTFYPEALTLTGAVSLKIMPGSIQSSIDVGLFRMHHWTVSGRVLLLPGIRFTSLPTVLLLPRDPSQVVKFSQRTAWVNMHTGAFEIGDIPPGSYTLAVDAQIGDDQYAASQLIDITKANVEGLALTLERTFSVQGHVTAEGSGQCNFSGLNVHAQSSGEQGVARSAKASVNDSGSFMLENLRPDHYYLRLAGLTGNCYLKSISLGASDVTSIDVQLAQGSSSIGFVLNPNGGRVDGDVIDDRHQLVKSATIVLVPQPPLRERDDLYKKTTTDQYGRFSLQGIPPGEYELFAWDAIESESYLDPDMLTPFESLGHGISVQEASQNKVELTVISNDGRLAP